MKILSEKISRSRPPGRGPFRGITHLESDSLQTDSIRLRGSPASIEMIATADGRRFTVRIDALETMRLADVLEPMIEANKELRGRAAAARLAHNQEVAGANPAPATTLPELPASGDTKANV